MSSIKLRQVKQILYAAAAQFFVQRQCILTAFNKNLLKKFDREKSSGVAFESDENLSARKDLTSQCFRQNEGDSLESRIETFREVGTRGTHFRKGKKQVIYS